MKVQLFLLSVLFGTSVISFAQSWPNLYSSTLSQQSSAPYATYDREDAVILTGTVLVADGIPLPQSATIQSECDGHLRTEGYTDAKGSFSITWNGGRQGFGHDANESLTPIGALGLCELRADVPGFVSEKVRLSGLSGSPGMVQVGHILIHAATPQAGNVVSATSAAAPEKARKNLQKGCDAAKKENWDAAVSHFREAVHVYPKYAQAWLYLGRVQVQQGNVDGARESFQQALTADSRFVDAYSELADLALKTKRWQELADDTDHILQLEPGGSQYWYLNSAANYELKQVDKAEKSALQGLRADVRQRFPQLQYLMAAILTLKQDYRGAAEHIRHYLRLAPHAENAAVAQQQLQQLEKLSGGE